MNEDWLKTAEIIIDGMHCKRCVQTVQDALLQVEGIEEVKVAVGKAEVRFIHQIISLENIKELIEESGYQIAAKTRRKKFYGRFIDRMIASNEKNFGTTRLDCCELSSKDVSQTKAKKGTL